MTALLSRTFRTVLRCATLAAALAAGAANALTLHVAPAGTDTNSGLAEDQPVRTWARALAIASAGTTDRSPVTVKFAAGDYGPVRLDVEGLPGGATELVLDGKSAQGRARFDGGGGSGTWMVIRGKPGVPTRLVVRGFEVRNHRMAIAYLGERGAAPSSTSHTRIEENLFENIGQQRADVKPAFAAITLVNSRSNQISRNTFRNITNIDDCGGLHAIYLASGSSDNRVEDNVFDGGCGDTIKTRDRSNGNLIRGNTFRNQTGLALYVDSFCDRRKVAACAKGAQECASWGNRFEGNKIDAAAQRSIKTPTRTAGAGNIPSCPAPKPGTARISVAP